MGFGIGSGSGGVGSGLDMSMGVLKASTPRLFEALLILMSMLCKAFEGQGSPQYWCCSSSAIGLCESMFLCDGTVLALQTPRRAVGLDA